MVVPILVSKGRYQKGAEELACHVLGKGHAGILGKSSKSRPIRVMGVAGDVERRDPADGQQVEGIAYISGCKDELLPGGEWQRSRRVEEAGKYGDIWLAAHDPLSRAGGIGLACGSCAWNAATAAFRNRRSSWRSRDYRWESRRVGALLPLTDDSVR